MYSHRDTKSKATVTLPGCLVDLVYPEVTVRDVHTVDHLEYVFTIMFKLDLFSHCPGTHDSGMYGSASFSCFSVLHP